MDKPTKNMRINIIAIITTLVALCIATNYALAGVPNVKFMDFIVFIGGFYLGPLAGASIGILTWLVYGMINPYGFVPRIWLATMFSESIYGVLGGFLGKNFVSTNFSEHRLKLNVVFGTVGFISTLIYDIITTIVFVWTFNLPIIGAIVIGVPFTVLHELSNTAIFSISSIPVIKVLEKLSGGVKFGFSGE